jgi:hypothetical protein
MDRYQRVVDAETLRDQRARLDAALRLGTPLARMQPLRRDVAGVGRAFDLATDFSDDERREWLIRLQERIRWAIDLERAK